MENRVGQQSGKYRLVRLLGKGGFAEVYLGEHLHLKSQAAIKILQAYIEDDQVQDFLKEAQTVVSLEHPHIVRILDYDVAQNIPFLVMSYASGGTLRSRHPRKSIVPLTNVISYVAQLAGALDYAHSQRVVHRDIKPENMLLDQHGNVLLSDFGIAISNHSTRFQNTQNFAGTPVYTAPEQLQGKPQRASDQYAPGIVVYEWLCGVLPFQGSFTEIMSQQLLVPPPPLHTIVPVISPDVESVVMKALAKNPQERFASVKDFSTALAQAAQGKHYAGHEATVLRQPSSLPRPVNAYPAVASAQEVRIAPATPSSLTPPAQNPYLASLYPIDTPVLAPPPPPPLNNPYVYSQPLANQTYSSSITESSSKSYDPIYLPLSLSKHRTKSIRWIIGYSIFMLLSFCLYNSRSTFISLVFGAIFSLAILLAGPILGTKRGVLVGLLAFVALLAIIPQTSNYHTQSLIELLQYYGLTWASVPLTPLVTGFIYERRKKHGVMLSWLTLWLGAFVFSSLAFFQTYDILNAFVMGIFSGFVLSIIALIIEGIIHEKVKAQQVKKMAGQTL